MKIQDRYEYDPQKDLLGKGGFARVFRAQDNLLHRPVALKIFNATGKHGYTVLEEIRKVIQFDHPNILRYFDVLVMETESAFGEKETTQIGVMELANAGDLKDFARANPGSPLLYKLLKDVLLGLEYLHSKGIIHRDLKAQNILLVRQDGQLTAKISDFGISKDTGSGGQSSSMMVGTIEYMAPEQFAPGKYGIDGKVGSNLDLWSFGIMVHELLTDSTPFGSRDGDTTAEQIMSQILATELPEGIERLPEPYRSVVKKCLVANAKERIRKASELLSYFEGQSAGGASAQDENIKVYPKGGPQAQTTSRDTDATKVYPKEEPKRKAATSSAQEQATKVYPKHTSQRVTASITNTKSKSSALIALVMIAVLVIGCGTWWYEVHREQAAAKAKSNKEAEERAAAEAKAKQVVEVQTAGQREEPGVVPASFESFEFAIRNEQDPIKKRELKLKARQLIGLRLDFGAVRSLEGTWLTTYKYIDYDAVTNVLILDEDATYVSSGRRQTSSARLNIYLARVDRIKDYSDGFEIGCPTSENCIQAAIKSSECVEFSKPKRCAIFDSYAVVLPQTGGRPVGMSEFKNGLNKIIYKIDGRPAI